MSDMDRVKHIDPVGDWVLMYEDHSDDEDAHPFPNIWYYAYNEQTRELRLLQTSRYSFHPTPNRFAWLIDHGIEAQVINHGTHIASVPWTDRSIDEEISRDSC